MIPIPQCQCGTRNVLECLVLCAYVFPTVWSFCKSRSMKTSLTSNVFAFVHNGQWEHDFETRRQKPDTELMYACVYVNMSYVLLLSRGWSIPWKFSSRLKGMWSFSLNSLIILHMMVHVYERLATEFHWTTTCFWCTNYDHFLFNVTSWIWAMPLTHVLCIAVSLTYLNGISHLFKPTIKVWTDHLWYCIWWFINMWTLGYWFSLEDNLPLMQHNHPSMIVVRCQLNVF